MKGFIKGLVLFACSVLLAHSVNAFELSWTAPSTNADGTVTTNLAGYKVLKGTTTGVYSSTTDVGMVTNTFVDNASVSGVVYLAIMAYDTYGNEGLISDELTFYDIVPNYPPVTSYTYSTKLGQLTLNFNRPLLNQDGSAATQVTGYIIGYGKSSKTITPYTNFVYFPSTSAVNHATITVPMNSGLWYTSVSATNNYGNISSYSGETAFGTTAPGKPGKPKSGVIDLR